MRVLIIEDDTDTLDLVGMYFELCWPDATVIQAADGLSGLVVLEREGADLVILDLELPDMDGLEVCRRIRECSTVPILILSGRGRTQDVMRGLSAGADDYLTKPFAQSELLARVQAVLRRTQQVSVERKAVFGNGELTIDFLLRDVRLKGKPVKLTRSEYELLVQLASNPGGYVPGETLLNEVWGPEYGGAVEYLEVQVRHLQQKLGDNPDSPRFITKEDQSGFKFIGVK